MYHVHFRPLFGAVVCGLTILVAVLSADQRTAPSSVTRVGQNAISGAEIFRTYARAVAVIEATDDTSAVIRFGSGLLLSEHRVVVTNAHVVSGPGRIRARLGSDIFLAPELNVQYVDVEGDLAVLRLERVVQGVPNIRLRADGLPDVGERVFAIGNPQGLERTFSEGVVSGLRSLTGIGSVIQHTAPISPGSSGGALFGASGDLIGLTVAYLDSGQNLNFAIPASAVAAAIDQAFDVPRDMQTLAAFAARTRKRFPDRYDNLDDQALVSRFRSR